MDDEKFLDEPVEDKKLTKEEKADQVGGTARGANVTQLLSEIQASEKFFDDDFKRMKRNMFMVRNGRDESTPADFYKVNLAHRHLQQRTSLLYARNPKAVAKAKRRLYYQLWDGDSESIAMAAQRSQAAAQQGLPPLPEDIDLVQDFQQGSDRKRTIGRVGDTLEILLDYYVSEADPSFKDQFKQMIKRMLTTGVGYLRVDYQRILEPNPDVIAQLARIDSLMRDMDKGEIHETDAEAEQLRQALKVLEEKAEIIVREGLTFDFPNSQNIIVDKNCQQLKGFVGADWVAEKFWLSVDDVKDIYNVDVSGSASIYERIDSQDDTYQEMPISSTTSRESECQSGFVKVYKRYDKKLGTCYTVCEGWPDYLEEPCEPNVEVDTFFPIFVYAPNEVESDKSIYPPSDIDLLRDIQEEYNRAREGLREHRLASRPKYAMVAGALDDEDVAKLQDHESNAVLPLKGLAGGQSINDVLQAVPTTGVDNNLYSTAHLIEDLQFSVGAQEAQFGVTGGSTAFEAGIAQDSTQNTVSSHIDELDDFFSAVARASGQILLKEVDEETAKTIAGVGAIWPSLTMDEIQKELFLDIEAGSSGRPNKAVELRNLQTVMPIMLQIPGMKPETLAKLMLERLDERLSIHDFFEKGAASIMSMNSQTQMTGANPAQDPNLQGAEGANNAPSTPAPNPIGGTGFSTNQFVNQ